MAPRLRRHTENMLNLNSLTTECWHSFYLALPNSLNPSELPIPPIVSRSHRSAAHSRHNAINLKCPAMIGLSRGVEHSPQTAPPVPHFPEDCLSALGCEA